MRKKSDHPDLEDAFDRRRAKWQRKQPWLYRRTRVARSREWRLGYRQTKSSRVWVLKYRDPVRPAAWRIKKIAIADDFDVANESTCLTFEQATPAAAVHYEALTDPSAQLAPRITIEQLATEYLAACEAKGKNTRDTLIEATVHDSSGVGRNSRLQT